MPTGIYDHSTRDYKRKPRIKIACLVCGKEKEFLESYIKRYKVEGAYCSSECFAKHKTLKATISCDVCAIVFDRRRDQIKDKNYCSPKCSAVGRSQPDAKWRDKEQIKEYMQSYAKANRAKINKLQLQYDKAHPDQKKERGKKYTQNNPDKINASARFRKNVLANGSLTKSEWELILEKYNRACLCCNKNHLEVTITMDHIIPISKGGQHISENVQPLCISCNSSKSNKIIDYRY